MATHVVAKDDPGAKFKWAALNYQEKKLLTRAKRKKSEKSEKAERKQEKLPANATAKKERKASCAFVKMAA